MLTLVRHGRTQANADQRLLGRLDPPLDERGLAQARGIARTVGTPDLLVSSPLRRCLETAEVIGGDVAVDDGWIELDYGVLDGAPLADVPPDLWSSWMHDPDFAPEGGESLGQLRLRVDAAIESLRARATEGHVVVVTHVSPIKAAVGWTLSIGHEVNWNTWVAPGSITRLDVAPRRVLRTFNETCP